MHPLGKARWRLYRMELKQVVASSFWLVFQFQHFKVRGGAARQFPVDGVTNTESQRLLPQEPLRKVVCCCQSFWPDKPACAHGLRHRSDYGI